MAGAQHLSPELKKLFSVFPKISRFFTENNEEYSRGISLKELLSSMGITEIIGITSVFSGITIQK